MTTEEAASLGQAEIALLASVTGSHEGPLGGLPDDKYLAVLESQVRDLGKRLEKLEADLGYHTYLLGDLAHNI